MSASLRRANDPGQCEATRCFPAGATFGVNDLYIPPGASLVLRTGTGPIAVSGEPSEFVVENQVGAIGGDFKVGPAGAPKLDRGSGAGLEVVGGTLLVGGRDRGTVSPGDHVELRGEGKLFVNGAER